MRRTSTPTPEQLNTMIDKYRTKRDTYYDADLDRLAIKLREAASSGKTKCTVVVYKDVWDNIQGNYLQFKVKVRTPKHLKYSFEVTFIDIHINHQNL